MIEDKGGNFRKIFSENFNQTFPGKFPKEGTVFDFCWDFGDDFWIDWSSKVPEYQPIPVGGGPGETPFSQLFVTTADTFRLTYLINSLARRGRHSMLVGSGSGKTSIIEQYLRSLDKDVDGFLSVTINMSYYTDSKRFQNEVELNIDKRSGKRFGPPATKRLIVFIDDMNLPYIETYGTQNSIAFLTQHMAYGTVFDRIDLGLRKELVDIQYIAAMNPTAGSFTICERAQRLFSTFACLMPSKTDLTTIFYSLLSGHVMGFEHKVVESVNKVVEASINLYEQVQQKFLPSAAKFTYNWSLRELTNVFQGICLMTPANYQTYNDVVKLWVHEFDRVVSDRMFTISEVEHFRLMMEDTMKWTLHMAEEGDPGVTHTPSWALVVLA